MKNIATGLIIIALWAPLKASAEAHLCRSTLGSQKTTSHLGSFSNTVQKAMVDIQSDWHRELSATGLYSTLKGDSSGTFHRLFYFQKLGFEINEKSVRAPEVYELIQNYHRYMRSKLKNGEAYLRPALVFVRKTSAGDDYLLIDPTTTTEVPAGYQHLKPENLSFNLPYSVVREGAQKGFFPLMGGLHDVSHFVGFMRNFREASAYAQALMTLPEAKLSRHFGRRLIYVTEYFSLYNGLPRAQLRTRLQEITGITALVDKKTIRDSLQPLDFSELSVRLQKSMSLLDKTIVDFGGATTATWERLTDMQDFLPRGQEGEGHFSTLNSYHMEILNVGPQAPIGTLATRYARGSMYSAIIRLYPRFFISAANSFIHFLKKNTPDDLNDQVSMLISRSTDTSLFEVASQREIINMQGAKFIYEYRRPTEAGREQLRQMLIDFATAIELQLTHAAYGIDSIESIRALLQPKLTANDPMGRFLADLYPGFIRESQLLDPQ